MFSASLPLGHKRDHKRPERVADQIRIEIMDILVRKAADPRVEGVSIVRVDLSPDLRNARIFVSTPRDEQAALEGLGKASGFIRSELAHRMSLRRVPVLTFVLDQETEKVLRLLNLLEKAEQETREMTQGV